MQIQIIVYEREVQTAKGLEEGTDRKAEYREMEIKRLK